MEEVCTTTSQIKLLASKTPFQALRPEARSKGWFQGSVSEENSPRRLAPNQCGDRLEKFVAKFAAKFAKKFATKFAVIFAAHFCAVNSQATMILQVAATMVTQICKPGKLCHRAAGMRDGPIGHVSCTLRWSQSFVHVLSEAGNRLSV